jgi:hypothetical protein
MRRHAVMFALAALVTGCATLPRNSGAERGRLWRQAHDAYARDSLRVAAAAFQRLATDHPRSYEGHESRFYLGVLALEPGSGLDLGTAVQNLGMYITEDSAGGVRGYHLREARSLLRMAAELRRPCGDRGSGVRCEVAPVATRTEPTATAEPPANAETARLRREVAERDDQIRRLREELERIRSTLAPRRTPR